MHLFKNYSNITQLELEDNDTKMRVLWDPNSPLDCLVQQLEDVQDYADDGGQPYTADQLLCIAYTLVFKTGLYFEDCKAWNAKPNNEKHGQLSKHISTVPNACSVTNFAPPNRLASLATSQSTTTLTKPNHPPNIVKLSSISPPQPQPTVNCSLP